MVAIKFVKEVRITFLVTIPQNTPTNSKIYITGNHNKLGNWSPEKVELKKVDCYQYQGSFLFRKNTLLHFKFTRGSWENIEKDDAFQELANRSLQVGRGQVVHCKVENWADMGKPTKISLKHTKTGIIREHKNFHATKLNNKRTVWVYLPPSYPSSKKRYPVLYVHDGNNVFDSAIAFMGVEWELDETTEALIKEKRIREIIIVAMENTIRRDKEYTHVKCPYLGGGDADLYADFIINDVKPFIDKTYRTLKDRQYTGIMGSSLGGLVSLYISWKHWRIFSMAGVVSPSVWWCNRHILKLIKQTSKKPPLKIWLDIGTLEGRMDETDEGMPRAVLDVRDLKEALIAAGFRLHHDLEYLEAQGAEHNEAAWAKRVDKILLFFFGSKSKRGFFRKFLRI